MNSEPTEQGVDRDRSDDYIQRSIDADNRLVAAYWDVRFFLFVVLINVPRQLKKGLTWIYKLLRGDAPGIGEQCCIGGCDKEAVARTPSSKRYSDGNPLCRRDFLVVKGAIYGLVLAGIVFIVFSIWVIV